MKLRGELVFKTVFVKQLMSSTKFPKFNDVLSNLL